MKQEEKSMQKETVAITDAEYQKFLSATDKEKLALLIAHAEKNAQAVLQRKSKVQHQIDGKRTE